ncbi:MAG: bifunctional folylpolyglutamate synthase/dihydrofolate synthase [Succinivibrio sp.]|nr:bifunctional folylpolyglutamate synthase/dihydrofolate synthase [Succinivibrio sp.]
MSSNTSTGHTPFENWLRRLESINPAHIALGLERVKVVLNRLALKWPVKPLIIEVAGTNGKGSTAALIAAALGEAGIKTALYTSPHVREFTERFVIDGQQVSHEDLAAGLDAVQAACQTDIQLTYFEYATLAAYWCFHQANVKVMVLEIGLGGRFDAVNAFDADIGVICSIGLEHTQLLGDSLRQIAFEKAGIIKQGAQVVAGVMAEEALAVIRARAAELNATLLCQSEDFDGSVLGDGDEGELEFEDLGDGTLSRYPLPQLPVECAKLALEVLHLLRKRGYDLSDEIISAALKKTTLPGRMQKVQSEPSVFLDVAHNPPAALYLRTRLEQRPVRGRRCAVIGMLKDKDIEGVLRICARCFARIYTCSLPGVRGESSLRLTKALREQGYPKEAIFAYGSAREALEAALPSLESQDELIVFGSFVTVTAALDYFESKGVDLGEKGRNLRSESAKKSRKNKDK